MKPFIALLATLLMIALIIPVTLALRNPAAVYCDSMGYNYTLEQQGMDEFGYCRLPGGEKVEAWAFLLGEDGTERSYCVQKGLELKIVEDWETCGRLFTPRCAVCVLKNGTETEMTSLMGLTFAETICGDGHCGFPENSERCPKDCPKNGWDMRCDRQKDGVCDPDCDGKTREASDRDCPVHYKGVFKTVLIIASIIILIAVVAIIFIVKNRHKKKKRR